MDVSFDSDIGTELYIKLIARKAIPCALSTREIEEESKNDKVISDLRKALRNDDWTAQVMAIGED